MARRPSVVSGCKLLGGVSIAALALAVLPSAASAQTGAAAVTAAAAAPAAATGNEVSEVVVTGFRN